MSRVTTAFCALLVCGCGEALAPPRITEIAPASILASDAPALTIRIDGVLPYQVDYGASTAVVETELSVSVGEALSATATYRPDGSVTVFVPSILAPGEHPVTITLADGRRATAEGGLEVSPGTWPTGYVIAPIGPQKAGEPFEVQVEAVREGARFTGFRGTVGLELQNPTGVTPTQTRPFVDGYLSEPAVVVRIPGEHVLVVRDTNGTTAQSNAFRVTP